MATTDRRSVARTVARPSRGRLLGLVALTWGIAVAFVLTVAADTRVGPVVFRLTKTHGVHLGDVYATLASAGIAMLITVWIVVDHMGRKRRWARAQRRSAREQRIEPQDPDVIGTEHEPYDEYGHGDDGYAEEYPGEYYDDEGHHALRQPVDEPDPDLVETVLIERDSGDYTGRHRPQG